MNWAHRWICRSAWWQRKLTQEVAPWVLQGLSLGPKTLEIGPGPGLTSDFLQHRSESLVCVELDGALAQGLQHRGLGRHVHLICADASVLPLTSQAFDTVVAFTMLHHVESAPAQDALFREAARVLRPGGVFAGTDSLDNPIFRLLHWRDQMQLIDPDTLPERLHRAGFAHAEVERHKYEFRFFAKKTTAIALYETQSDEHFVEDHDASTNWASRARV